jgi:hypothetical protein
VSSVEARTRGTAFDVIDGQHDAADPESAKWCNTKTRIGSPVLIVVDDLEAAKAFFAELGMELEGETTVEGPSVDRLIGLQKVRATLR